MFKSIKKKSTGSLMFLLLFGLLLLFSNSSSAQQASSYQNANFADKEVFFFSKIFGESHFHFRKLENNFWGFGVVGLQKQVKVLIDNPTDIDVEIKDVESKDWNKDEAYKLVGIIKAKGRGIIYTTSSRTIIARVAGKRIPPFARQKMNDKETDIGFQVQKSGSGYNLVKGKTK